VKWKTPKVIGGVNGAQGCLRLNQRGFNLMLKLRSISAMARTDARHVKWPLKG